MKKLFRWSVLCVLFLSPLFSLATVTRVYPGNNSFSKAIAAAKRNDTLLIQPGVYKEHDILINKKLTVIGQGYPIIDGESKSQIIFITADSVVLQGLQVQNTGRSSMTDMAAIRVQNANYALVQNNKVLNNTYGVYLQNATFCTIQNNVIHSNSKDELNSGNGIHAWKCNNLIIRSNRISGHRDGIYFEFVTESHIIRNISTKNVRYGLHFMFSHNDTYTYNQFVDNASGVAVMYSKGVIMLYNTFRYNWGDAAYAILLKEIANTFDVATNGTMMLNNFKHNYWDKYDGYDLNKNGIGDVPYYPVSVYAVLSEQIPTAMILYRSFLTNIMDQVEKVMPSIIPDQLKDDEPSMKKWKL